MILWRYSLTAAVAFLLGTAHRLVFWGFLLPLGRHTGILIGIARREPTLDVTRRDGLGPKEDADG